MKKLLTAAVPYLVLLVGSLVYCAPLFTGWDFSGRSDWDQFTFRYLTPRLAMLRDGQLPLWNPYVNGGNVLLAHPHVPAFSPLHLVTLAFEAEVAVRIQAAIFVILGTTGMAALLRRWRVSPAGSILGGLALMMSAHFTLHLAEGHVEWCVLGLVPWIVLCLDRAEHDRRWLLAGGALVATMILHGSVYILAVFSPVLLAWSLLEAVRRRRWRPAAHAPIVLGTGFLLSAVVLLPRIEFALENPRSVERDDRIAFSAWPAMLLDPGQAGMFRSTRDAVNPPRKELADQLAEPYAAAPESGWQWRRLEVELSTTSDWTDVRFSGVSYVLRIGRDALDDIAPEQLELTPPSTEGLAIKNNPVALATQPDVIVEDLPEDAQRLVGPPRRAVLRATLHVRRSRWNSLHVAITRGDQGSTRLVLRHEGTIVADCRSAGRVYEDRSNRQTFDISMQTLTHGGMFRGKWLKVHVRMRTTSDWARLEAPGLPCLFAVEDPAAENDRMACIADDPAAEKSETPCVEDKSIAKKPVTPCVVTGPLELRSPRPGREMVSARTILFVPYPERDDLRLVIRQGAQGRSRLELANERFPVPCRRSEHCDDKGERLVEYTLSRTVIQNLFEPLPKPWRWTLNEMEMNYGWHEYACYLTWVGLALAAIGVVVAWRSHWPLMAAGLAALLVSMGAALPIDPWKILSALPFYGSMQVSARFLAAVVFVLAVCAGFGLDWLGRLVERLLRFHVRRLIEAGILAIVFLELVITAWGVFSEVFVCRPPPVEPNETFAQRHAVDVVRRSAMYGAHCPYAKANGGVLRDYENMAVPRGAVRLADDAGYRGEAYLLQGGTAAITDWSMSRVVVAVETAAADRLVLNQNYFTGWKARILGADGRPRFAPAEGADGLVSVALQPGDSQVDLYYLPDSFLWGSLVSALAVLGCVAICLPARTADWTDIADACRSRWAALTRHRAAGLAGGSVALNLPFLLCHPAWPVVDIPVVRALAIGLVLLILPGWPIAAILQRRGGLAQETWVARIAISAGVLIFTLVAFRIFDLPPAPALVWNAAWLFSNLGLVALATMPAADGDAAQPRRLATCWPPLAVFVAAFLAYAWSAASVVPAMDDHDFETQGTAYSLVHGFVPKLLTDRHTAYYFAHPPLLHVFVAGSFVYWNELDDMRRYETAWNRRGDAVEAEVKQLMKQYEHDPHRLATRTPNVLMAALTVALLAAWVMRRTGLGWFAVLAAAVYTTSPEVFVRSSYGGYFAISQFALLEILLFVDAWHSATRRGGHLGLAVNGLLAGGFAAVACHKLVFLPAAIAAYEVLRGPAESIARRCGRVVRHPVVIGFVAGTLLFWTYGLAIHPGEFWREHFRTHLVDRVLHENPLGYSGYPSPMGLWQEFCRHTGYVLLPLGVTAMAVRFWFRPRGPDASDEPMDPSLPPSSIHIWILWAGGLALAFTLIDWRQTKHLAPLFLPLVMAPAAWAGIHRPARIAVTLILAGLLFWNLGELYGIAADFGSFSVTPGW